MCETTLNNESLNQQDQSKIISQNEIDKIISELIQEFPTFDEHFCHFLLKKANYDAEEAINKALKFYKVKSDYIQKKAQTQTQQDITKSKKKHKKAYLDDKGKIIQASSTKKQKKMKKKSQLFEELSKSEKTLNNGQISSSSSSGEIQFDHSLSDSLIQKVPDYEEKEDKFYRNALITKYSSTSKAAVNKTTRMPERHYKPPKYDIKTYDFHEMTSDIVHDEVLHALDEAEISGVKTIYFITGAGHHSIDNSPVLRKLVIKLCKKRGFNPIISPDGGCITINLF